MYGEKVFTSPSIKYYSPLPMKTFKQKYSTIQLIYSNELSSSTVSLVHDENGKSYACKSVKKKRLRNSIFHDFTRNEMALQYSLSRSSDNIARVEEYFEDDVSYAMVMEYSSEPQYFEELLEDVIIM